MPGKKSTKNTYPTGYETIEAAYAGLPEEIRKEIQPDYLALLHKAHNLLRDAQGHRDPDTMKIAAIISDTARSA